MQFLRQNVQPIVSDQWSIVSDQWPTVLDPEK